MYLPAHFAWDDPAGIPAFCRAHAFATVIAIGDDGPEAQHLPLLVDARPDGGLVLHGHVAVGDPLWRAARALTVFTGPHAYVSAAWYDEPDLVPTWNYLAVHAAGALRVIDDPATMGELFARLATTLDPAAARWQERLSAAAATRLTAAIRWFRIDAVEVTAKVKLSQNHPPARRRRVIDRLAALTDPGAQAVAAAMTRTLAGQAPWPAEDGQP